MQLAEFQRTYWWTRGELNPSTHLTIGRLNRRERATVLAKSLSSPSLQSGTKSHFSTPSDDALMTAPSLPSAKLSAVDQGQVRA